MSRYDRPALAEPVSTGHSASTPALRMMSIALHGLFFTLLAVLVVRGIVTGGFGETSLIASIALGSTYALGGIDQRLRSDRRWACGWLALVLLLWAGLTVLHPEFGYLAFPLYFVLLHLLPLRWAVPGLLGVTGVVVASQAQTDGGLSTAKVLGPLAGLAVAVLTAAGYAALYRESRARARAVDAAMRMVQELTEARSELAVSQREAGRLAERQRLAAEIHDTLAQGLSNILLLARTAESALPGEPGLAADRIREVAVTAAENLAEARRFVQELTPPALEESTLAEALRRLSDRGGAEFRLEGEPYPLPVEAKVALLRLTQEALSNAVQHASASRIAVTLGYLDDEVTLDVFDDGVGFSPTGQRTGEQSGFGLHGMRERIAALGGRFAVESAPGEGTAIAAALPLRALDLDGPVIRDARPHADEADEADEVGEADLSVPAGSADGAESGARADRASEAAKSGRAAASGPEPGVSAAGPERGVSAAAAATAKPTLDPADGRHRPVAAPAATTPQTHPTSEGSRR